MLLKLNSDTIIKIFEYLIDKEKINNKKLNKLGYSYISKNYTKMLMCSNLYNIYFFNIMKNNLIKNIKNIKLFTRCKNIDTYIYLVLHDVNMTRLVKYKENIKNRYRYKKYNYSVIKNYITNKSDIKLNKKTYLKRCNTKKCMNLVDINTGFCYECYFTEIEKNDNTCRVCLKNYTKCTITNKFFCSELCEINNYSMSKPIFEINLTN